MESRKILAILVMALGLIFCSAKVSEAGPMGTAITYQGRLIDANSAADGLHDFAFKLYDANVAGSKVGNDVNKPDVETIDGYFTVELDFGSTVFDGNAVWLEIGVRPGDLNDPNVYTLLSPRQEVTPTPYAIYAKAAGSDNDWMISGNDMYAIPSGNIGIGTTSPQNRLDVEGAVAIGASYSGTDTAPSNGMIIEGSVGIGTTSTSSMKLHVMTYTDTECGRFVNRDDDGYACGVSGLAQGPGGTNHYGVYGYATGATNNWAGYFNGNLYANDKVGIGTESPQNKLDVEGAVAIGGSYSGTETAPSNGMIVEGNVGIGITSPSEKLHVVGNANITGSLYAGSGSTVLFADDVNGRVGVGTTSTNEKLTVEGVLSLDETAVPSVTSGYGKLYVKSSDSKLYFKNDGGTEYDLTVGAVGDSDWTISGVNVYRVSGNVGIGTSSPSDKLHVVGDAKITGSLHAGSGSGVLLVDDAVDKVGIGTASPTEKLEVSGNVKVDGDLVVTGAYRGNIGLNNGAPFPRPAYDSGWQTISADSTLTLTHGLDGDADNYVVDLQFKSAESGRNNLYYGYDYTVGLFRGAAWWGLTSSEIKVGRLAHDPDAPEVRVRIWVYN